MQVFHGLAPFSQVKNKQIALSVGNFDGIHLGHQELLKQTLMFSKQLGVQSGVLTFDPHPVQVLRPELGVKRMFPVSDLEICLKKLGFDFLIICPFTKDFAQKSPQEFLDELSSSLQLRALVVGFDFHFGEGKAGDVSTLTQFCEKSNVELAVVPAKKLNDGQKISSTLLRSLLCEGNIEKLNQLLGRSFYSHGVVQQGEKRGQKLGFPTANLRILSELVPNNGVYFTKIKWKGALYPAVTNVGTNPTFNGEQSRTVFVESHLLNFSDDLYGQEIDVFYLKKCRDEKRFLDVKALTNQISEDIMKAQMFFKECKS